MATRLPTYKLESVSRVLAVLSFLATLFNYTEHQECDSPVKHNNYKRWANTKSKTKTSDSPIMCMALMHKSKPWRSPCFLLKMYFLSSSPLTPKFYLNIILLHLKNETHQGWEIVQRLEYICSRHPTLNQSTATHVSQHCCGKPQSKAWVSQHQRAQGTPHYLVHALNHRPSSENQYWGS